MEKEQNFTEGRIFAPLIHFALPVIMMAAAPFLADMMHAPEEAYYETVTYIIICSAGTVFIVAYNLVGSIFRGIGDSKVPLITVAIATVSAQAVSVLISLVIIRRRELPFAFSVKDIRVNGMYLKKILWLGIPIALQDLLANISFLVILAIMNGLGLIVSAGVGVAEKMCGFLMLVASAYMQSMSAFVAQNIGAGKTERARKALACCFAKRSKIAGSPE